MTLYDALLSAKLWGGEFGRPSWRNWRTIAKAISGQVLDDEEAAVYSKLTQRTSVPAQCKEVWVAAGRRSGKSRFAAAAAAHLALLTDWKGCLSRGEVGTVAIIAPDRRQCRTIFSCIEGLIDSVPFLNQQVLSRTRESLTLRNQVRIEVHTASYRFVRGHTVLAAIIDELAFLKTENSTSPDREILAALRPPMATVENSLLVAISSPYSRRGELWRMYHDYFGAERDDLLIVQAPSRDLNPRITEKSVRAAFERDPISAASEWEAQFRTDLESYVSQDIVEACVIPKRYELPPCEDLTYRGFVDPSGGSRDSFTLAIGHNQEGVAVLDCVEEIRPPFSPETAVDRLVKTLERYRVREVVGDKYAGLWPREQFEKRGITYKVAPLTKSEYYLEALPLLNAQRVELLDVARLKTQLCNLERRTSRVGRDAVDHGPGQHDDLVNSALGCLVLVAETSRRYDYSQGLSLNHGYRPKPGFNRPRPQKRGGVYLSI